MAVHNSDSVARDVYSEYLSEEHQPILDHEIGVLLGEIVIATRNRTQV